MLLKVFYTWGQSQDGNIFDPGFGRSRQWDIPILEGYDYEYVRNTAGQPGSHHFWGIVNPQLINRVKQFNPDAILVYGWSFYSHLKLLHYFKGKIPIFFRGDSTLLDYPAGFSIKKYIRTLLLKWIYRSVNKFFYSGQANKKYFISMGVKEHQLFFAPHAIDNSRFTSISDLMQKELCDLKHSMGITDQDIVFLFAGKFEKKKNPALLISAFKQINLENIKLILVGNGHLESSLKELAKDDHRIIFLDFQNQASMPVVYRLGDVFVLPSRGPGETWGLSVNEAFASGIPAIVSDRCGCHEDLVINGETGYLFTSNRMDELINCIIKMADKNEISRLKNNLPKLISRYSIERTAEAIESVLDA